MSTFRIVLLFFFFSVASLLTLPYLDIDFIPTETSQSYYLNYSYSDSPPLVIEQNITAPLENILSQLTELESIYSSSGYGTGYIRLTFLPNADLAMKELEIKMLLRAAKARLPSPTPWITVNRSTNNDTKKPLLIYEFLYPENEKIEANNWLSSQLLPALNSFASIENIELSGQKRFAWEISYDKEKLFRLKLTPQIIMNRISETISREEIGVITKGKKTISLFAENKFFQKKDLEDITLQNSVRLKDIASIRLKEDRVRQYKRINGKNAVLLSFVPYEGINRIETAAHIRNTLMNETTFISIPSNYNLQLNYDDTEYLSRELNKTWVRAGLSFLVLVLLILLVNRSFSYLLTLFSSIFVSYCITLGLVGLLSIPVHLYSLAAITIAMGIIIDNCIILLDHLKKYGNLSVLTAQLAASITTVASLVVVFLLPNEYQSGLEDFAYMLSLSLIVSFFVSWWFSPAFYSLLTAKKKSTTSGKKMGAKIKTRVANGYFKLLFIVIKKRKWLIAACILFFGIPVYLLPSKLENQEWYNKTMGSDWYLDEARPVVNRILGGTSRFFYQYVYENSYFRTPEKTRLFVNASLPYGHTLQQMNDIVAETEAYLSSFPQIEKFITQVYSGQYASITIEFSEEVQTGSFPYQLKGRIIERSIDWGGVDWSVYGVGKGFSNASGSKLPGFSVTMKGYNYEDLETQSEIFAQKLLQHKRIQEVNTNSQLSWQEKSLTNYYFIPEGLKNDYLTVQNRFVREASQTSPSLYVNYQDEYYPLYVSSSTSDNLSLYRLRYEGLNGKSALDPYGKIIKRKSLTAVHKEDRQYIRNIAFDYFGSYRFGKEYLDKTIAEMKQVLPSGYSIEQKSWSWQQKDKEAKNVLLAVVLVILFFITAIHLNSIKKAIPILIVVPFSFTGIFLVFGWLDFPFDQGGYASFLLVSGLSLNAVLYLLSDLHHLSKNNTYDDALRGAITGKAWPVTLTIISTCMGLLPFLIHGTSEVFWYSFAIGSIGGLMMSLFAFFFVVPVFIFKSKTWQSS